MLLENPAHSTSRVSVCVPTCPDSFKVPFSLPLLSCNKTKEKSREVDMIHDSTPSDL